MVKLGQVPFLSFSIHYSLIIQTFYAKEFCCLINYSQMGLQFQSGTAQVASTSILILLTYCCANRLILQMHSFEDTFL
jgi:hypothetical protein